jgi:hypothetical protein
VKIFWRPSGRKAFPYIRQSAARSLFRDNVLRGEFVLVIEGRPDQLLKVGDSCSIPANAVHYARVPGDKTLRVHCAFISEKNKPLATVTSNAA